MPKLQLIAPCLWFDANGEDAARFYVGIFPNSKITATSRYPNAGQEIHGKPPGSVMTVAFELNGQPFTALNGGSIFKFNEAVSFQVLCDTQQEIDHYWNMLNEGGDPRSQQCGWLKDKFGLSWQVVPRNMDKLISSPDPKKTEAAFKAMLKMKKIIIADLERAVA